MKALFLALLFPVIVQAEQVIGLSALAASNPSFPCDRYLELVDKSPHPGMSVLVGTFGRYKSCIKRYLARNYDRPHTLLIYLENGPCQNNNRCQPNERSYPQNIRFLRSIEPYMGPNTRLWVSPKLEDKNSAGWHKRALKRLQDASLCPGCYNVSYVRNSVSSKGGLSGYDLREYHGLHVPSGPRSVVSNDGVELSLSNVKRWRDEHADAKGLFLWTGESQGIRGTRFIKPLDRSFQISVYTVKLWNKLLEDYAN